MSRAAVQLWKKLLLPLCLCSCAATPAAVPNAAAERVGDVMSSASGPLTMSEVLASSQPADWRSPDAESVLYLELATGRVVFELAPTFAPEHVKNVKALVREGYFDGLTIVRVQDNY